MTTPMLPRRSIDVLRDYVDIALDAIGVDCTLYIPTDEAYSVAEKLDVFAKPSDYENLISKYSAKVFIHWNPSLYKLKKLGLFTEDSLPILVRFGNRAKALTGPDAGTLVPIDVSLKSYFEIEPEFIHGNYKGVEQFELVNVASQGMQDVLIRRIYSAVPRRVQM